MALHLLKLAVGIESVADLARVQKARRAERRARGEGGGTWHFTRNFPRRAEEVLDGGSLYWIIRGEIVARQRILGFEERRGRSGRKRCAIALAAPVIRTVPLPHRAIQGWRYLRPEDAPRDLAEARAKARGADRLPAAMARELRDLGLL
ncbi:MAG TPA: DUF1489 domain-containing protein [Alphaproteobacteria bacterium]|jgi:hypothetical protein